MSKKIIIELENYDLELASIEILKHLISNNPNITRETASKMLGISTRTMFRWIDKYDIAFNVRMSARTISAINLLKNAGYKIEEPLKDITPDKCQHVSIYYCLVTGGSRCRKCKAIV